MPRLRIGLNVLTALAASTLLAGCFKTDAALTVTEDGTFDGDVIFAFDYPTAQRLAKLPSEAGSFVLGPRDFNGLPNVSVKPYDDGTYRGQVIHFAHATPAQVEAGFEAASGDSLDLDMHLDRVADTWTFQATIDPSETVAGLVPTAGSGSTALGADTGTDPIADATFQLALTLPGHATDSNATTTSPGSSEGSEGSGGSDGSGEAGANPVATSFTWNIKLNRPTRLEAVATSADSGTPSDAPATSDGASGDSQASGSVAWDDPRALGAGAAAGAGATLLLLVLSRMLKRGAKSSSHQRSAQRSAQKPSKKTPQKAGSRKATGPAPTSVPTSGAAGGGMRLTAHRRRVAVAGTPAAEGLHPLAVYPDPTTGPAPANASSSAQAPNQSDGGQEGTPPGPPQAGHRGFYS